MTRIRKAFGRFSARLNRLSRLPVRLGDAYFLAVIVIFNDIPFIPSAILAVWLWARNEDTP